MHSISSERLPSFFALNVYIICGIHMRIVVKLAITPSVAPNETSDTPSGTTLVKTAAVKMHGNAYANVKMKKARLAQWMVDSVRLPQRYFLIKTGTVNFSSPFLTA